VNTPTTIGVLLETVFSIRSVQSGCKKSSFENWQSSSGVKSQELGSAREAEKMVL
jgi:hypothetical protein